MKIRNERGFTLLEVIIVVVIIAVLAAAVIPRFSITRDEAEKSACKANVHMIKTQIELYKFDNGTIPSMSDLVNNNYFDEWPQCPSDPDNNDSDTNDYSIDANGVVTCNSGVGH